MSFLSPLLLLFGLAATVPLVLHLYRQRQRVVMPFSTDRFFTRAIVRAQRRLRLRRILLLLLRIGACLLIAMAVARPILRGVGLTSAAGSRDVVILLDDSLSMQAAQSPRPSHFEQARREAIAMLRELVGGDRAAVVTFSGRQLGGADGFSDRPAELISQLEALPPSFAAGDAAAAIGRAGELLEASRHRRRIAVAMSDLQAGDWSGGDWPQPQEPLDLAVVPVLQPASQNVSVESLEVSPSAPIAGQPTSASVRIVNHGSGLVEAALVLRVDETEQSRRKLKLVGGGTQVEMIPLELPGAGVHRVTAAIDAADGLPADNRRYAAVEVQPGLPVLLVDGQEGGQAATQPAAARGSGAFYLRAAMQAAGETAESGTAAIRVDVVAPSQLAGKVLDDYRVVVLSDVGAIPQREWQKLEWFIRNGGGMAVFPGESADPQFYATALGVRMALPATAGQSGDGATASALHVQRIVEEHPLFARFGGELRGALLRLSVYRCWPLESTDGTPLASMEGDRPLVIERDVGKGRMLIWAMLPVPGWTSLPLRRAFVPLVSQMLSELAGAGAGRRDLPGQVGLALELPAGKLAPGVSVQVTRPDGTSATATTALREAQAIAHLPAEQVAAPGFYGLSRPGEAEVVRAVNLPRSESSPEVAAEDDLRRRAGMWRVALLGAGDDAAGTLQSRQGWMGLWDALLWATAGVVLIETIVAARQTSAASLPRGQRAALWCLRGAAIACAGVMAFHLHWQWTSARAGKPVLAVMLDDSASMGLKESDQVRRIDRAMKLWREMIEPRVAPGREIVLFDVAGKRLEEGLEPGAGQQQSPIAESLVRIGRALRGRPLRGIILLSDGADTKPRAGVVDDLPAPVYPVEVAAAVDERERVPDLSIEATSINERTLVGNTVRLTADLRGRGDLEGQPVNIAVLEGGAPVKSKMITWPAGAASQRVELEFAPQRAGHITYALQVGPVAGEKSVDDNRRYLAIDVRAKPITVIYIDGVLRWESKFLREALSNDPDLNLISSIRTMPPAARIGSRGLLLPDQLGKADVVILGDVEAGYFSPPEMDALRSWVIQRGGGLLLTGGYHSFGPAGFGRSPLRELLPVEFSASEDPQIDRPFNLRLTEIGQEHAIFSFSGDRVRDTRFMQSLPRLDGCSRVAGIKPGAEVLAVNGDASGGDGAALPVMVTQEIGEGRAMVFAADTTWRWRMIVGGFTGDASFYQRFWGQIVRWLAHSESGGQGPALAVTSSRATVAPGQTAQIQARLEQPARAARGAGKASVWRVAAESLDSAGNRGQVPLTPMSDGSYRAAVSARTPGRLDVIVTAMPVSVGPQERDDAVPGVQMQAITVQVDRPDVEMVRTDPDPQWLRQIARQSGGRYLKPDEIAGWAASLPAQTDRQSLQRRVEVWRHPILTGIFLSLLCAEWIIRRRKQLL